LVVCRERNSHDLLREEWDCAIPEIRAAEAAVRETIDTVRVILIAANELLTPTEVTALGLRPGEIRKRL
jgi:hypothetical protein